MRPSQINFVPENEVVDLWEEDYKNMMEIFIYEEDAISFDAILKRIKELRNRFRAIQMDEIFFDDL